MRLLEQDKMLAILEFHIQKISVNIHQAFTLTEDCWHAYKQAPSSQDSFQYLQPPQKLPLANKTIQRS